jgi:hypothetical protein
MDLSGCLPACAEGNQRRKVAKVEFRACQSDTCHYHRRADLAVSWVVLGQPGPGVASWPPLATFQ